MEGDITRDQIEQIRIMQEAGIQPQYENIGEQKPEEKFLEQLNPDSINNFIMHELKGEAYDDKTKQWTNIVKRKITDDGINEIMTRVRSIINTNTIYSNLDDEIIQNIVVDFTIELTRFLSLKYKDFNMEIIDINKIPNFCSNMAYIALRRASDMALTLRMLRTMIQTKELSTSQGSMAQSEKKSFWDKLFKR